LNLEPETPIILVVNKKHIVVICIGLLALMLSNLQSAEQPQFLLKKIKGKNSVGSKPENYVPPKTGENYPLGYWLKTHSRSSSMLIELDPRYVVLLRPKSEVVVSGTGNLSERFQRVIDLKTGGVEFDLEKLPKDGKIRVETPTAVGGAVGTKFTVDVETGEFNVTEGSIEAETKNDTIFKASSVSGRFFLQPGLENSYVKAENISGTYLVNQQTITGKTFSIAKAAKVPGDAALVIDGKAMLMRSGKLEAVGKSKNSTHRSYMKASSKEGTLFAERESLKARQEDSTKVNAKLIAAAKAATALRLKLFQRKTARDAAKQGAKAARDAMRRR